MLSLGVETWSKSLHKVGFTRKARVFLGLQSQMPEFPSSGPRHQGPWCLAPGLHKTSFCAFQKPHGLSPLAQIKCSRAQTFRETSGILPKIKHYYPIYQTLSPDHSGVPRHVRDLISDSEQHSVINILYRQQMLSVRTLRVRELCRHDRDTSLVNNQ